MSAHEFDVVMTVRRRLHVGVGGAGREVARDMLIQALKGGMAPSMFEKRDESGHVVETVLSNDFVLEDPAP